MAGGLFHAREGPAMLNILALWILTVIGLTAALRRVCVLLGPAPGRLEWTGVSGHPEFDPAQCSTCGRAQLSRSSIVQLSLLSTLPGAARLSARGFERIGTMVGKHLRAQH